MQKIKFVGFSISLWCFLLFALNNVANACNTQTSYTPELTTHYMIRDADVIVRATAKKSVEDPRTGFKGVEFQVEEVLKGEKVPSTISFYGLVTSVDYFNDMPIPYGRVRKTSIESCYALEYKLGAEFLLFLKKDQGKIIDPYWRPLSPTNEQLHPGNDKWLQWIRNNLTEVSK